MPQFNHIGTYLPQVNRPYQRIARIIQAIIAKHITADGRIDNPAAMEAELRQYGQSLAAWAQEFWNELLQRQQRQLHRDWNGAGIKIAATAIEAETIRSLAAESVQLIKTLPVNAARVAQEQARKAAMVTGDRAESLVAELQGLQPGYPEYAAKRLARTEIAKAQSDLVQAQAVSAGVPYYIWRTMGDGSVRDQHAELDGKIFSWSDPPYIEGEGAHGPGQIWNCRCFAQPLLVDPNTLGYTGKPELEIGNSMKEIAR